MSRGVAGKIPEDPKPSPCLPWSLRVIREIAARRAVRRLDALTALTALAGLAGAGLDLQAGAAVAYIACVAVVGLALVRALTRPALAYAAVAASRERIEIVQSLIDSGALTEANRATWADTLERVSGRTVWMPDGMSWSERMIDRVSRAVRR